MHSSALHTRVCRDTDQPPGLDVVACLHDGALTGPRVRPAICVCTGERKHRGADPTAPPNLGPPSGLSARASLSISCIDGRQPIWTWRASSRSAAGPTGPENDQPACTCLLSQPRLRPRQAAWQAWLGTRHFTAGSCVHKASHTSLAQQRCQMVCKSATHTADPNVVVPQNLCP